VIRLDNVSKRYNLRANKPFLLRDLGMRLVGKRPTTLDFWALRDVSLEVKPGEAVGVVGRNGAGKSTLLGIIAGTIFPNSGNVATEGRVCALLELGVGFNPDLTGRENVYLNAALLGLSEDEVNERYDDILKFAELEDFIDMPVCKYSSGMTMRLGFSVAIHIEPEVFIVDEMLTVGDQSFQKKCLERITQLKESGTTFLLVSHNHTNIKFLCSEVVWLDKGEVRATGSAEDVLGAYTDAFT